MNEPTPAKVDPERVVLEGVPRVGFYHHMCEVGEHRCPEDVPFPSCLRACLEFMGDRHGCKKMGSYGATFRTNCSYAYLMGASGCAFRLNWKPGWHGDNVAIHLMSDNPSKPFRRAFAAVGYDCEIVHKDQGADEAYFRRRIVESVRDAGRPAIARGVLGPPEDCIITGYDEGGDVLVGWSYFQYFPEFKNGIEFEPNGYFRKRDWFKDTWSLLVIGEKQAAPNLDRVYREALEWAIKVMRTPLTHGDRHNGIAAFDVWAEHLERDADFEINELAVLRERHMAHDDAVSVVAEGRWYGALFLARIAEHFVFMAPELFAAAACFAEEHELMWRIWNCTGGTGRADVNVRKFAKPDVRRQIVPLIQRARDKDTEAASLIECALAKEPAF